MIGFETRSNQPRSFRAKRSVDPESMPERFRQRFRHGSRIGAALRLVQQLCDGLSSVGWIIGGVGLDEGVEDRDEFSSDGG
ncbi:MAG TPA: hypothetical protein VIU82_14630, partial [Bosea sp. (in: a-proteobacteria)]